MRITGEMKIADVLRKYPACRRVFVRLRMQCRSCQGAAAETVAAGAVSHGIDPAVLLDELNRALRART